jgi:glycosyltransferase involved in cell wall biosynthesis
MSLVIVIPAYEAARYIAGVLRRIEAIGECGLSRVIVVDDGSTDDTARVAEQAAFSRCPLSVVRRSQNGGYGAALKDLLDLAKQSDPDVVACVHADGQYSPEVLPELCAELRRRQLDVLQGSRIASGGALKGGMPLYKYVGNALLNLVENRTLKLALTDYHSGYLLYGRRALSLPFRELSDSFDFDLEVIASARARGLVVGEAPIPTHYGDEKSHLNPLGYGLRVLRVMWNYRRGRYAAT